MKVRVQYMSQLRTAVGRTAEDVDLPDGFHVSELLRQLASRCDAATPHLVTESGQARPSLMIVVNDVTVPAREATATELHDGDEVILLPPIAGG